MAMSLSSWWRRGLGQGVVVESLANSSSEPLAKAGAIRAAADFSVGNVGGRITSLLGQSGLLFEQRDQQFVCVLSVLEGQNVSGVDLVQRRDFSVEVGAVGQRIILYVADRVGRAQRIRSDGTNHL